MKKDKQIGNLGLSDEKLVKGCLKGDGSAQKELYEKYKIQLFRVCLRYSKDHNEAEDMLQDGFIKIFTDLHQFSFQGPLGAWMRRVVVNVALQHIRKNKRLEILNEPIEAIADEYQTDAEVFSNLNIKTLTKLIQMLPDGYRVVFNMYVIEGYSHKEIAEQLNIQVNTSKSQLSKAKNALKKMLEKIMVN
jgi:RNA polymerase sigma-70 factor (ECF subfamily)